MSKSFNPYDNPKTRKEAQQRLENPGSAPAAFQPKPQAANRSSAPVSTNRAMTLPEDYVTEAENAILRKKEDSKYSISTTKLRNLFSLFTDTYNELQRSDSDTLTPEQMDSVQIARIRLAYEMGRQEDTKSFSNNAHLMEYLYSIKNSSKEFTRFYHYVEALVAYARYYDIAKDK